jgi:protein-disulfide isomerase
LLLLGLAASCKAQTAPLAPLDSTTLRHIEVLVRSQFNVPPGYGVAIGAPVPSMIAGYDKLPITISRGVKSQVVDFLISTDGKTLARLETFGLVNDPSFDIDITGRPIRGNPDAKVTVISFDDLECPYCSRMHEELFPATLAHYKNLVRFVYKDDPIPELHPWAMHAAVDATCLAAQSGPVYWNYVDYLHAHGQEITGENRDLAKSFAALDRIARQEATLGGLDQSRLDACLAKQDETAVRAELRDADALGLEGTPELFVNGERIDGAQPQQAVWMAIDRALRDAGEQPPPAAPSPPVADPGK